MCDQLNLKQLVAHRVLGRGAMGTVFLVTNQHPSSSFFSSSPSSMSVFALKIVDTNMKQTKLDTISYARWEVEVLSRLHHPFLPSLLATLDDGDLYGWAIPLCPGGNLNVLRRRQSDHTFSPSVIRFYLAEIVLALEHLHSLRIVYRDLKPENILIQESGHVMLTDFDLSKMLTLTPADATAKEKLTTVSPEKTTENNNSGSSINNDGDEKSTEKKNKKKGRHRNLTALLTATSKKVAPETMAADERQRAIAARSTDYDGIEQTNSFVGTEEYVAPEVIRGDGHAFAVDWWSLGILAYEMMYGQTPFHGANQKETFHNVLTKTLTFPGLATESTASLQDLIAQLLEKDPAQRLGSGSAVDVKCHEFFRGLDWEGIADISRPPIIVSGLDLLDQRVAPKEHIDIQEFFRKRRATTPTKEPNLPQL